jgi:putative addiction module CopG family antidote
MERFVLPGSSPDSTSPEIDVQPLPDCINTLVELHAICPLRLARLDDRRFTWYSESMNPTNQQFVNQKLQSGEFNSTEAVIDEALRRWRENDTAFARLKAAVQEGLNQLDEGLGATLDIEQVIAEGRERRKELAGTN